jgi:hypothetical protein
MFERYGSGDYLPAGIAFPFGFAFLRFDCPQLRIKLRPFLDERIPFFLRLESRHPPNPFRTNPDRNINR